MDKNLQILISALEKANSAGVYGLKEAVSVYEALVAVNKKVNAYDNIQAGKQVLNNIDESGEFRKNNRKDNKLQNLEQEEKN